MRQVCSQRVQTATMYKTTRSRAKTRLLEALVTRLRCDSRSRYAPSGPQPYCSGNPFAPFAWQGQCFENR